jgi:branched-chain amino acid aminotransferase
MRLLADAGVPVAEGQILRSDLYQADEAFFTGTAAEVTPIREIDDRVVGSGLPGPVTRKAQELFQAAVRGELAAYRDWLEFV